MIENDERRRVEADASASNPGPRGGRDAPPPTDRTAARIARDAVLERLARVRMAVQMLDAGVDRATVAEAVGVATHRLHTFVTEGKIELWDESSGHHEAALAGQREGLPIGRVRAVDRIRVDAARAMIAAGVERSTIARVLTLDESTLDAFVAAKP